jgi:predicted NAD/FAD-dependent oxidoreductase
MMIKQGVEQRVEPLSDQHGGQITKAPQIAVIGAGIAGLACATALQQAGCHVHLFDKSRGAGGRMSTRRADDWQCDHGAQYFTARDSDFRAEVTRWQQAGAAALWDATLQAIDADGARPLASTLERFVGTPRMSSPAALLAQSLNLTTGSTIVQLRRTDDGRWHLRSSEDGDLEQRFDAVMLALPSPQASALLQASSVQASSVQATSLPALAELASGVAMSGCWTLMLRFAVAPNMPYDAAFINHGPLRWVCRNNSKPGRSGQETWLLHASPEWSSDHLEQDADTVAALLLQAFGQLNGPAPDAWTAHRWRYAQPQPALSLGCTWDADITLGLCGDWLNGGKVEGAWLSGRALALRYLSSAAALT